MLLRNMELQDFNKILLLLKVIKKLIKHNSRDYLRMKSFQSKHLLRMEINKKK